MKQYDISTFSLPEGEALYDALDELAAQAELLSREADRYEGDPKKSRFYGTLAELGLTVRRMNEIERKALFSDGEEEEDPEERLLLAERFAVLCGCFLQAKDNIILNMENIRATEETNESMLTPLERHLWNQFLNGTEEAGNGNE